MLTIGQLAAYTGVTVPLARIRELYVLSDQAFGSSPPGSGSTSSPRSGWSPSATRPGRA
ncbi:MAG: hypothetical protein QOG05_3114 [Streptosporangiaceae bacterium]|nr:hypothetical protein [Streptosporangiaceae bacterium]